MTTACAGCGFDASGWSTDDLRGVIRATATVLDPLLAGVDRRSPDSDLARVVDAAAEALGGTVSSDGSVRRAVRALYRVAASVASGDDLETPAHAIVHVASDLAARLRTRRGGATQRGTVHQINVSGGGVPKTPVETATIDAGGIVGDVQGERRLHGRPHQAMSLWGLDVIGALAADGHPIAAGSAGENLTIDGVSWPDVLPGMSVHVGEDVVLEVSVHATPCAKNKRWFTDGDLSRIDESTSPGRSRLYAWVRRPGTVTSGAEVLVTD